MSDDDPALRKPRRNIFELFKKRTETQSPLAPENELFAADSNHAPERREFAARVIALLGREVAKPAQTAEKPGRAAERPSASHAERAQEGQPPFVGRVQEIGRRVLTLIGHTQEGIRAADEREGVAIPTDLEPLAVADADLRAAIQELIAPIEAYPLPEPNSNAEAPEPDAVQAALKGSKHSLARLAEPASPISRAMELAAAVASVTAREVLDAKEKAVQRTGRLRKAGLFALGAATAGGFAYTWRRLRQIKKEQRAMHKNHKRFEAEVRAVQAQQERRLHELEGANVQHLPQTERQQFVYEVSELAHAKASEIRGTAQSRGAILGNQPQANQTASSPPAADVSQASPLPVWRPSAQGLFWGVVVVLGAIGLIILWAMRIL